MEHDYFYCFVLNDDEEESKILEFMNRRGKTPWTYSAELNDDGVTEIRIPLPEYETYRQAFHNPPPAFFKPKNSFFKSNRNCPRCDSTKAQSNLGEIIGMIFVSILVLSRGHAAPRLTRNCPDCSLIWQYYNPSIY